LVTAVNSTANFGDEVVVLPGDYGSSLAPITTYIISVKVANLSGVQGLPRPRIFVGGAGGLAIYNGGLASNLEIQSSGSAAFFAWSSNGDHLIVNSTTADACRIVHQSTLSNSTCVTHGGNASAVTFDGSTSYTPAFTPSIRNVTAWSTGSAGKGISLTTATGYPVDMTVTNSIIHGGSVDVLANADASPGTLAHITLDHSNYATALAVTSNNALVTPPGSGSNQTAAPLLVDPTTGDVRQALNSPTIDAGIDSPTNGLTDVAYGPRTLGLSTDIGAYEFTPVTVNISGVSLTSTKFRVGSGPTFSGLQAAKKKKKKAPLGTTLKFVLDQKSKTAVDLRRASKGATVGGVCVKRTKKLKRRKTCTRWLPITGGGTFAGQIGPNELKFSGRVNGKKLSPGKYQFVIVANTSGGSPAAPVAKSFSIVR
jgi:hypothetical protein